MKTLSPPPDFSDEARAVWKRAQSELRAQGTWRNVDGALLEAYCRSVVRARVAHAVAQECPFTKGSAGQTVAHPAIRVAREAEADARAAAQALLLSPEMRKRHELDAAPDREEPGFLAVR